MKDNVTGYNVWSKFYDDYPNPTVAIDDLNFPEFYSKVKNKSVLEIGCGTGRHTVRLLAQANKVVAVDPSCGMIEQAKRKTKSGLVTFINGDVLTTSIPQGPFDAIVMALVLEHIKDLHLFFKRCRSLIRDGGVFVFSEIHPERAKKNFLAHFKDGNGEEVRLNSVAHSECEIRDAARVSGFRVEKAETVCGNSKLTKINTKWSKYTDSPMIQIWELVSV